MRIFRLLQLLVCLTFVTPEVTYSQSYDPQDPERPPDGKYIAPKAAESAPEIKYRLHKNGKFWDVINNNGILGNMFGAQDPDLKRTAASYYFPRYSRIRHGYYTGVWVGGVLGNDTLVSADLDVNWEGWWNGFPSEFWPDYGIAGDFKDITPNISGNSDYLAKSQVTFSTAYTDTFQYQSFVPYNTYDRRYHMPLNIRVDQTSYSWSYDYAEDFIIVDYKLTNLGEQTIQSAFLGLYHIGGINHIAELPYPRLEDQEGFIDSVGYDFEELGKEALNTAWVVDIDGHPEGRNWGLLSTVNCFGIAPLHVPSGAELRSFNWWVSDAAINWGPRKAGTRTDPYRSFTGGGMGLPLSDKDKYYMMSHPEIDYSGYTTAVDHTRDGWLGPPEFATQLAEGHFVHFLLSVGPFDIPPHSAKNVTVVYSIGEKAHTNAAAYDDFFNPYDPYPFLNYLNFDDLIDNVRWAKRIYDNPGVDTDGDGDSGKFFWYMDPATMDSLQVYYEGDGVPDFRGATPPPPPPIRVHGEMGKIVVQWNGRDVENYFDSFSLIKDFEGYRVHLGRSEEPGDISMIASYDREDYNRYIWNPKHMEYDLRETPFTIDSLRALYGSDFQPLDYTRAEPLEIDSNYYYFTMVDYNESDLLDPNKIHKMYPDATLDTNDVDDQGRMRYYEYEYIIEGLLPSVPYFVAVTAFDFGHPAKSLSPLESSPAENLYEVFALPNGDNQVLKDGKLDVYCYPNPYRADAHYDAQGYENRFTDLWIERGRAIYFANLPDKCTLSIFSLDGDLVKRIDHNEPAGSGTASVDSWDLISRNMQSVVSGLYYWVVESDYGNQVGKLVIIK